jgi:CheY-like chemotaxis protein
MSAHPLILLVDDEQAIIDNLAALSKRAEFAVAVASDREEALKQVAGFAPNLIVLDVLMPKLDE